MLFVGLVVKGVFGVSATAMHKPDAQNWQTDRLRVIIVG